VMGARIRPHATLLGGPALRARVLRKFSLAACQKMKAEAYFTDANG